MGRGEEATGAEEEREWVGESGFGAGVWEWKWAGRMDFEARTDGRAPLTCSTDPPISGGHFSLAGSKTPLEGGRLNERNEGR